MQYHLLSIDNAKRIEFLSGGGSAVYGSGAFGGVINIITKEAEDVDGLEAKIIAGSYDARQANFLFGKSYKSLEISANLNFYATDGFDGKIDADAQTAWDEIYGTDASMAPGKMKGDEEKWDGQLTLKYNGLTFDGRYTNSRYDLQVGNFIAALDDENHLEAENYYLNLSYEANPLEGLSLLTKIYRNHYDFFVYSQVRPAGALVFTPTGPVVLQEGTLVKAYYKTNRTGIESQLTYEITDAQTMVAGFLYEDINFYDANTKANFAPTGTPGVIELLPDVRDSQDKYNFDNEERSFMAVFWEDVWDMRDDLRFNIGCRYDVYSDFGDALSPRAGLNWQFTENFQTRLLYSRAFRAPSLEELYEPNWGNKDLDAVIIDVYELGFNARFLPSLNGGIGFFYSKAKDYIIYNGSTRKLENQDKIKARGLGVKLKYDFGRGSYLAANYTYTDSENRDTGQTNYAFPAHMGSLMTNVRFNQYLNWNTHCIYRGGWTREDADSRDDMSDYAVVNTTLITRKFLKGFEGLELSVTVNNLFDEDYTSPTPNELIYNLPDDLPMPGRNYLFQLRYTY